MSTTRTTRTAATLVDATTAASAYQRAGEGRYDFGDPVNGFPQAMDAFAALSLHVPAAMVDELDQLGDLADRLRVLSTDPAPTFTLADLNADDYAERFRDATIRGLVREHGTQYARQAWDVLGKQRRQIIARNLDTLYDITAAHYEDHAAEFWHHDDDTLTGAQRDERGSLNRNLHRAAAWLWRMTSPGAEPDLDLLAWFEFAPEAWKAYVADCLPAYQPKGNLYDFATKHGGRPRLVRSLRDATRPARNY